MDGIPLSLSLAQGLHFIGGGVSKWDTPQSLGVTMRVPTGPLFKPFDYALMVGFAMAFIMLTTLRLA